MANRKLANTKVYKKFYRVMKNLSYTKKPVFRNHLITIPSKEESHEEQDGT